MATESNENLDIPTLDESVVILPTPDESVTGIPTSDETVADIPTPDEPVAGIPTPGEPVVILPPPVITLDDILSSVEVVTQKEREDKANLESISTIPYETLKTKLLSWATSGFPNVYEIHKLTVTPPTVCSDGVTRNLSDYIEFCSGKPIQDHVSLLQQRVQGMSISFTNMGTYIAIVVSRT